MKGTLHWSATEWDWCKRKHYQLIINYDPEHKQAVPRKLHNYTDFSPQHTWMRNTNNIGIACACLGGEDVGESNFGEWPLMSVQIEEMCRCAAEISLLKRMTIDDWRTHAEYAIEDGYFGERWDLAILKPGTATKESAKKNGDLLRRKIAWYMARSREVRAFHKKTV